MTKLGENDMPVLADRKWTALALLLLVSLLVVGCQSSKPKSGRRLPSPTTELSELHLLSALAAVSPEGGGGSTGFAVRIYASSQKSAKTVPIGGGTVEILMFDGIVPSQSGTIPKPLRVWNYTARELAAYGKVGPVGASYSVTLPWGEAKPTQDRITVVACYTSPQGKKLYSAPATVFVSAQ